MALFSRSADKILDEMTTNIRKIPLDPARTVVVNMNTVNGYFKDGYFSSPAAVAKIPKLIQLNEYFLHSRRLFIYDTHNFQSSEFKTFPEHCTTKEECAVIDELERFLPGATVIEKNGTNPFFCPAYLRWTAENKNAVNFVICGGMTDISVMQYALSLKAYANQNNKKLNVVVLENATQSFSTEAHDGNVMHRFALYNMMLNGVIIAEI
ncbi:MAG: isochorismatase family protein [Clostridia bacterium]|nr:isochorismatase family protein [Clostridia bacterium]